MEICSKYVLSGKRIVLEALLLSDISDYTCADSRHQRNPSHRNSRSPPVA